MRTTFRQRISIAIARANSIDSALAKRLPLFSRQLAGARIQRQIFEVWNSKSHHLTSRQTGCQRPAQLDMVWLGVVQIRKLSPQAPFQSQQ
ncbi:MAG: hypothetical protein ABI434_08415 [Burkholderiaceae bacterium]